MRLPAAILVWLSSRAAVLLVRLSCIRSILDRLGLGGTGGGSFFVVKGAVAGATPLVGTVSPATGWPLVCLLAGRDLVAVVERVLLPVRSRLVPTTPLSVLPELTAFFILSDRRTLVSAAAADGLLDLAFIEEVLFMAEGRAGSLSVGFRGLVGAAFCLVSDSVDESRRRRLGDGDRLVGVRATVGTVLLGRLLSLPLGEGLREVKLIFSPMCESQARVGAKNPPLAFEASVDVFG